MGIKDIRDAASIREAMGEFDRVGRTYFLEKYGFRKSREFMVRDQATGRLYDSKAIVGAAYGYAFPEAGPLRASDFSGGETSVNTLLTGLGFQVVRIGQDWTLEEVRAIVADYFEMLRYEANGLPYNKSEHNAALQTRLQSRSKASIEMKHQNISAILDQLGLPYIQGYKPRSNVQELLQKVVIDEVQRSTAELLKIIDALEDRTTPGERNYRGVLIAPPVPDAAPQGQRRKRLPRKLDFAARDEHNRRLGRSGETWVMDFEKTRLIGESRPDLISGIDWISDRCGDGAGYDILSFEPNEVARFIEVKTTNGGALTPFIVSQNELEFSEEAEDAFCLYRVFDFARAPRLFILRGMLSASVHLEAIDYRARLKALHA